MKDRMFRYMAVILIFIMAFQILPIGVIPVVSAATNPSLSVKSKTVIGTDSSFTVRLLNPGKNIKRMTWYSQDDEIAMIEPMNDPKVAKVTTVGKGVTNVKCKITYKNGSIKRPACKVTVKIAATNIKINNAQDDELNNNRHVIAVGENYDFNYDITPDNANDNVYWVIDNGNDGVVHASVTTDGIVTGLKTGFVRLTTIASFPGNDIYSSRVTDTINIEIVPKTVGVKGVNLVDTTTLIVTFDNPIDASTVIGSNNQLLDSVVITPKTNSNNVVANSLGVLKAYLSADGKTLTIRSQYNFDGIYSIKLTSNIKGKDGSQLQEYFDNLELEDNTPPAFKDYQMDATGLKITLNFTEPMDFTNMIILNPRVVDVGKDMLSSTYAILEQEANYKISEDKKSLTIDLTYMATSDRNKTFAVNLSNIKDLAGNYPISYPLTIYFSTDTTLKPQARLLSVARTNYNTLTATYDRPILSVGTLLVNNNEYLQGKVDQNDPTKVNYTLSAYSVSLSGIQKVYIGYWNGYNVNPDDTSANAMFERNVDFTVDKTAPLLIGKEVKKDTINGVETQVITFSYNKDITLIAQSGTFTSYLITINNVVYTNKSLEYTASASGSKVTVLIRSDQMTEGGTYTITIPSNFVRDQFMNISNATTVSVTKEVN